MRTLNQRIRTVFLVFVFFCAFFLFGIPSSAADLPRLVDQADLLTDSEESALSDRLDEYFQDVAEFYRIRRCAGLDADRIKEGLQIVIAVFTTPHDLQSYIYLCVDK